MGRSVALAVLAIMLAAVAPVSAKEGVVAKVRVPISREAAPGTKVTMVWELTMVESGRAQPFDADGIYLRLFGPGVSRTPRAYAERLAPGRYRGTARVPRGGVTRVVVGLMGWNDHGPAPVNFPVIGRIFR